MSNKFCPTCGQPMPDASCPACAAAPSIHKATSRAFSRGVIVAIVAIILVMGAGLATIAIYRVRRAEAVANTMQNLKLIGDSSLQYAFTFRHLPPPRSRQPGDHELGMSWRVPLGVNLNSVPVRYHAKLAWHDPANEPLLKRRPTVLENYTTPDPNPTQTHFQYFTGPKTLFPDLDRRVSLIMPDGLSHTFLVAEADESIPWTMPADMVVHPDEELPLPALRFLVLMADGSVRQIDRRRISDDVLRLAIDPADEQPRPSLD